MVFMKRSLLIFGLASTLGFLPAISHAVTASPSPDPSVTALASPAAQPSQPAKHEKRSTAPSAQPSSSTEAGKKVAQDAAREVYAASVKQAQNGRDLAFADANANLMQSLQTAGKDKVARLAARAAYKAAANGIVTAFKQAIQTAKDNLKTTLQGINGK